MGWYMIKKTLLDTGLQTGAKALTSILGLVVVRQLVIKLGLAEYGVFVLLSSTYLIWDVLADFGTKIIGVKEAMGGENREKTFAEIFVLRLILCLIVLVLGGIFAIYNPLLIDHRGVALFALGMVLLTSLAGYFEMLCQAEGKLQVKSLVDVLFSALFFIWLVTAGQTTSLWVVYLAYMTARVVSIGVGFAVLGKKLFGLKPGRIDLGQVWKLFLLCVPMGLYHLIFVAYDRNIDTWLLSYFWGKEAVASYGVAYKVYSNLVLPAAFFMNSIFPKLSSEVEAIKKKKVVYSSAPWLMFMAIGLIVVSLVMSPVLMAFMIPARSTEAAGLLRILSFTLIFSYANHLLGFYLLSAAKNGQKKLLFVGAIGLCLNIILNLIIIPILGDKGAALVTVSTEALVTASLLWLFLRQ